MEGNRGEVKSIRRSRTMGGKEDGEGRRSTSRGRKGGKRREEKKMEGGREKEWRYSLIYPVIICR